MTPPQDQDDELPHAARAWQLVLLRALASHGGALAVGIERRLDAFHQLLTPRAGFDALADAISCDASLVSRWGALTVRELLTAFRDSDALLVRRVCRAARIHPDYEWATLEFDAVVRVADALRSAADA